MGSICAGSGQLELLPGFYSSLLSPGGVFESRLLVIWLFEVEGTGSRI